MILIIRTPKSGPHKRTLSIGNLHIRKQVRKKKKTPGTYQHQNPLLPGQSVPRVLPAAEGGAAWALLAALLSIGDPLKGVMGLRQRDLWASFKGVWG